MPVYYSETSFSVIALDDNESLLSDEGNVCRNGVRCDTASNISDEWKPYATVIVTDITDLKMPAVAAL